MVKGGEGWRRVEKGGEEWRRVDLMAESPWNERQKLDKGLTCDWKILLVL